MNGYCRAIRRWSARSATAFPISIRSTTCRSSCCAHCAPTAAPSRCCAASISPSTGSRRACATAGDGGRHSKAEKGEPMKSELKILTPQGMLGYGIPEEHFWRGVQSGPDAIVVDSGSTDPGPYLLGLSKTLVTREAYLRDVSLLVQA